MEPVSKALAVLSDDSAHYLFAKIFYPALLLQTEDVAHRGEASRLLMDVAAKVRNPKLAALASQVKLGAVVRVKKAIDDMVATLLKEKADEIKRKDAEKVNVLAKIDDLK